MSAARTAVALRLPKNLLISCVFALTMALGAVAVGPVAQPEVVPETRRVRRRRSGGRRRRPDDCPAPGPRRPAPVTRPSAESALFAAPDSPLRPFAEAIAWLWRLGPVGDRPQPGAVGIGTVRDADELDAAVRERRAAGAVVFAAGAGSESGVVPARRAVRGVAGFARDAQVFGDFTVFTAGPAAIETRLGRHAVRPSKRLLLLGCDPLAGWGQLSALWALQPLQALLVELLERPLLQLPSIGCLRFDDLPGTAYQQLVGEAKSDARVCSQIERLVKAYAQTGATLNVAVAARAMREMLPVPIEEVWPRGTAALARGVEQGVLEPVCHGFLHLDLERGSAEAPEPREFAHLDSSEAGRRIDEALAWQRRHLRDPRTFVAPAWGYSKGALAAAVRRGLPAWHRPAPEPLLVDGHPRETLVAAGAPGGVHRLTYGSLVRLAAAGMPPTPVFHGGLLDGRLMGRPLRDAVAYARLALARDTHRLARLRGIRWIGAGELVERLAAHGHSQVRGAELELGDGAEAVVVSREGRRLVRG